MKNLYRVGLLLLAVPLAAHAGAWTLPRGQLWTKLTFFRQETDEWYIASPEFTGGQVQNPGERRPYRFDGQYESKGLFAEAFYGLTDRFDLGIQTPYFAQKYADDTRLDPPDDSGIGDIRLFAKGRLLDRPVLFTLKAGAKLPTGDFRNEDGLIPVGEGQWDFDLITQFGRSFWPLPLYANLDLGYRIRLENEKVARDPGDEWFFNAELGADPGERILLIARLEGLRSDPSLDFGVIENRSQIKRITYFSPALSVDLTPNIALETSIRFSLNGRNFPAGHQFLLGLSSSFGR